ncbi:carbohydrate ABC transporter permease [Gracilibacillus alcaliphilus]|uniref:carbohydrate ABC transporter permease n=1 Tax=Gracilibacillus alcaliphilus TaxID=1401441 RepID=UPI00195A9454|nr:sugar ABC transporter permease [Gracilibacillus alcaliphilus]MBM7675243.1 ABC-type sugar transport system permease subunit [Gracilibacillus alcaliphilus]
MKQLSLKRKRSIIGYSFIFPWIIGFLLFTLIPFVYSLFLSFQQVKITPSGIVTTNVKWENYIYAFRTDLEFMQVLLKFLRELVISTPIIIVFALIIALLLNQPIRLRTIFRMVFFLPVIIASGPVIMDLMDQGVTSIPAIEEYALFSAVITNTEGGLQSVLTYLMDNLVIILWYSGVQILIFLAGLQKMDQQVYEAAKIDGASNWECFWKVTLPALVPMIVVNLIYTIVTYSIFALNPVVEHIQNHMFEVSTGFGYASALSWIYFVVITLVLLIGAGLMMIQGRKTAARGGV